MDAISVNNLTKRYPGFCLDNVTFTLPSGCIMGLIGENGAGKSTTIHLLLDLIRRDSGEIFLLGQDNRKNFQQVKEQLGVVLDEACFPEGIHAKDVNCIMKNSYRQWDEALYYGYLRRFQLPEKKPFKEFSRGMKMKLAIAVALSHHAKLLILDEATSGLDPIVRDEILDLFYEFIQEEDHSILISSHITSDLEKLCDYIAFIHRGKLLFCEEKDRLLERYGILHCSKRELEALAPPAVRGYREGSYGVEALVDRTRLPRAFETDRAGIEDIIVFMAREGARQGELSARAEGEGPGRLT